MNSHRLHSSALRADLPRYHVVLHYAADCGLLRIVEVLRKLTRFAEAEAKHWMWQAYHCGRTLVLATHKERAELFVEQFEAYGLKATIEPAW